MASKLSGHRSPATPSRKAKRWRANLYCVFEEVADILVAEWGRNELQRPISLTIIGWLLILFAVFGLIGQFAAQDNPVAQQVLAESPLPASVHMVVGIIGALVSFASGYGILKGLGWSRYLYVGWSIVALLFALATTPFTSVLLISVLIVAIIAFFLFRPAANAWFADSTAQAGE
jgi:hypothetical protein